MSLLHLQLKKYQQSSTPSMINAKDYSVKITEIYSHTSLFFSKNSWKQLLTLL